MKYELKKIDKALLDKVRTEATAKLADINALGSKEEREEAMEMLSKALVDKLATEESGHTNKDVKAALIEIEKDEVRRFILDKKMRVDGRKFTEVRQISCEVGVLPRTHGSGLFTRGQTQSLSVT